MSYVVEFVGLATMRISRLLGSVALVSALVLSATQTGHASPGDPRSVEDLIASFGVDALLSDYVIVIDESGSMAETDTPLWPQVQEAYRALVGALPDGSRLNLITFSDLATIRAQEMVSEANRPDLAARLDFVPSGRTDIGAAIDSALSRLEDPAARSVQTVIFITDGQHAPPEQSIWRDVGNSEWDLLHDRAIAVQSRGTVRTRAIGLGGSGRLGAELVSRVFSGVETVELSPGELATYLTEEVRKAQLQALADAVTAELASGRVVASFSRDGNALQSEIRGTLTLHNAMDHLAADVDLRDIAVTSADGSVRSSIVDGSRTIHLLPQSSAVVEVVIKPDLGEGGFIDLPPEVREEADFDIRVVASAVASPQRVIQSELAIADVDIQVVQPDRFTATRVTGITWLQAIVRALLLLALLSLLVIVWWKFVRRPRLVGTLKLLDVPGESVRLKGKVMRLTHEQLRGRPGDALVKVYTRRGKAGRVYVDALKGTLEVRGRAGLWQPARSGGSIGASTYRINGAGGGRFLHEFEIK